MIINFSRSKTFHLCQRKAFNWHHRGLEGQRSMNLVDGGAFHKGVAVGRATKDWSQAYAEADRLFDEDVKKSPIPEEQIYLIEDHRELIHQMIKCFQDHYEHETYQIIQPECEFDVPLPHSSHNCIFIHWRSRVDGRDYFTPPTPEDILLHRVQTPHAEPDRECFCWQPHRLVGKTDAVVSWNNSIWLDEYKTTSIQGQQFWDQWVMDLQPSVYLYGIWKSLGIRPRGFLLNSIFKPSEAQVSAWNKKRKYGPAKEEKDYIQFSREAFLRTEEDLMRTERLMLQTAMDWEEQVVSGSERMMNRVPFQYNPGSMSCLNYNRKCDYWSACLSHEDPAELGALATRQADYVDVKLEALCDSTRTA
jgi:hypothetical protein